MMSELSYNKRNLSSLLCLIPYLFLFNSPTTTADVLAPIKANCTGGLYSPNSNFGESLRSLFSSLSSNSSTSNAANATAGAGNDTVYGLYFCQGDLAHSDCQSCIQTAITDINQSCSNSRQGIIWYDSCELRYSGYNFFGIPDTVGFGLINPNEKTSSEKPYEMMSDLVQVAPFNKPLMFATSISHMYPFFALAQCSSDLSTDGCRTCLTTILAAIKGCCTQAKGWRYLSPSCWIRYESTPFFSNPNETYTEIIRSQCSENNFPSNGLSTERANLNSLLSELKSNARLTGFYNTSAGENTSKLYGLTLCRGDLAAPSSECTDCLDTAGSAIPDECPNKTEGIMWYDKCFLKYSSQSFFGIVDVDNVQILCNGEQVSQDIHNMTVTHALSLVQVAVNRSSMFAADKVVTSNNQSSYVLVQCTRDLTTESCRNCLTRGINEVTSTCKQVKGWRYLSGSCTIRYEASPFFNETVSPSATGAQGGGRQWKSTKVNIIAIVFPIVGALLLG